MANKKIIIIGAGLSGLCAGSYLQMNGYDTEIFELHTVAGGLPPAILSGRNVTQIICKKDGKKFTTQ